MGEYVAVVIPAHVNSPQRLEYFKQCLGSVNSQSFPVVGIVVDDSSSCDIQGIIKENNSLGRLRYVNRHKLPTDSGSSSEAMNLGIDLTLAGDDSLFTSEEKNGLVGMCYLHSDDLLTLDSCRKRVQNIGSGFVYGKDIIIKADGSFDYIKGRKCFRMSGGGFPHHTSMWSLDLMAQLRDYVADKYNQTGVFDESLFGAEDRDVTMSTLEFLASKGQTPFFISSPLYVYRNQDDSISYGLDRELSISLKKNLMVKHGHGTIERIRDELRASRIMSDLPWSLATYLPECIKRNLRGIRDTIKGSSPESKANSNEVLRHLTQLLEQVS